MIWDTDSNTFFTLYLSCNICVLLKQILEMYSMFTSTYEISRTNILGLKTIFKLIYGYFFLTVEVKLDCSKSICNSISYRNASLVEHVEDRLEDRRVLGGIYSYAAIVLICRLNVANFGFFNLYHILLFKHT